MDLMSVKTNYKDLDKKYVGFRAPTIQIFAGGKELVEKEKLSISEIQVELTSGYEASGCQFDITGIYDAKKTDFSIDVSQLQIGEKIEIALGYIKVEKIFSGYISQIEYCFGTYDISGSIHVECMDVKGLLMKNRRMEFFTQKSLDAAVKAILGETPISSYIDGSKIDSCNEEAIPLRTNMMTDYEIIVEQANKMGYEFFVVQGKVYFREKEKVTSSIMKLSPQNGIYSARLTLSGQQLVKTIEIRSIDQKNAKLIKGKASITGTFSVGSTAKKMIGDSKQVFYEPGVQDANEANQRAKVRVEKAAESFGEIECSCIGIPEIGPGRFIEIEGLAKNVNQKYYTTYVRHTIDQDGFRTNFKARVNSL